jgi:hypothetical protein
MPLFGDYLRRRGTPPTCRQLSTASSPPDRDADAARPATDPDALYEEAAATDGPALARLYLEDLRAEMIVYTPEQLVEIGNREYVRCETEMKKAARELGFGDDWRAALEKVKNAYVPRGKQPELVRNLQIQAETFIRERDLLTIPLIVHDTWRTVTMAPAHMRSAPFFLGGESIIVSYPVEGMSDELGTMIMKGNGPHLSHAPCSTS